MLRRWPLLVRRNCAGDAGHAERRREQHTGGAGGRRLDGDARERAAQHERVPAAAAGRRFGLSAAGAREEPDRLLGPRDVPLPHAARCVALFFFLKNPYYFQYFLMKWNR